MPADNLEIFKKVIFQLPDLKKSFTGLILLGVVYSTLLYFMISEGTISALSPVVIPFLAVALFIVPGILASEAYSFFLSGYPRKWGYFLSLVNQLIIFLFTVLVALASTFTEAWNIIWLGLTTLYASNFFVLVLSNGPDVMERISVLSMIQPVMILTGFHFVLGRYLEIGLMSYLSNFLVVIGAGIVLLLAFYLTEFLVGSNVSDISMLSLATALLQNRQEKLDIGRDVRPDVQTLELENSSGLKKFLVPWLHPGPLQGFGGGQITSRIIEQLNNDGEGFFLHVPSCHQMDPSDPGDAEKVLEASKSPEKSSQASKLVKGDYGFCTFYGRKLGSQKIVFMEVEGFDDYDAAVFQEIIDKDDVLLIDLHNQPKTVHEEELRYGTTKSDEIREKLQMFLQDLEEASTQSYSAGFAIDTSQRPVMALVEESGGQRTILFGVEGNDASENLLELQRELEDDFDRALMFTTDTHASIHELASESQVSKEKIRELVDEAVEDLSEASAGFSVGKAERMKFLTDEYFGLIYTINILVRLIPIVLVALYILLVVWLI
ncbi:DUF2070 family protein [Candidatus Nanosalina sp. VS9-1]|uniref:DUF2070 family protein n=1 Tax=Candidatus Nanosalina sp. VS9-1 TaxID=3388566 RepID=UPI0039E06E20